MVVKMNFSKVAIRRPRQPDPSTFSDATREILASENREDLFKALEKHDGVEATMDEVVAVRRHALKIRLHSCSQYVEETTGATTREDRMTAFQRCIAHHVDEEDEQADGS